MYYLILTLLLFTSNVFSSEQQIVLPVCKPFISQDKTNIKETDIKYKKGLLWQIETPEGKINYLFGTMHSQDHTVSPIPPKVRLTLAKSKTLLMETIPNEEANQTFLNMMYFKDKQRLEHFLEPELLEALTIKIQDYGVAKEHANFVKPWAAFSLIGRPKPVRAPTLESNLYQLALDTRLNIKSLETMEEILSALDGLAMEDQVVILKDTICNHEQIIRDTKTLVDLYINRNLQGIVEFNNQPHHDEEVFQRFLKRILYNRNIIMLSRIKEEFKSGDAFVAVGASHLADEKGLLNELENSGYKLTVLY
jgi:uncharacterized protein